MSRPLPDFGLPKDTFYWGPSRATPQFMADYTVAWAQNFAAMKSDPAMPNPPDVAALFRDGKTVWLLNQAAWSGFVDATFEAYLQTRHFSTDYHAWQQACEQLGAGDQAGRLDTATAQKLISAQQLTLVPEYALYGASASAHRFLDRYPERQRQDIWATFTASAQPPFSQTLDAELASTRSPAAMAKRYPWINDGYFGLGDEPKEYFAQRLKVIDDQETNPPPPPPSHRDELAAKVGLSIEELQRLTLISRLAGFMDERKRWMMETRRLVSKLGEAIGGPQHGWVWQNGTQRELTETEVETMWARYLDYESSGVVLRGLVASNIGQHYLKGRAYVTDTPSADPPPGSILVVPATSPTYVPLMRRAKALVTDHGGIMSHAAIVAREFGLPCIVGTQEATKLIQTGDEIVLDLVKGEITK